MWIANFGSEGLESMELKMWFGAMRTGLGSRGGGGDKLGSSERGFSLWIKGVTAV